MTPSAHAHDLFLLGCVAATVVVLLLLITKLRLHAALALVVGAFGLGIGSGMTLKQVPLSFTAGVGNMMGHIAIILGLGAILGCLLARSGGAQALGTAIVDNCGPRGMPFALMGLGIVVGMPVFFEVGLVLLMPIIAAAARRAGKPPILTGLPLLAGLSIVHGTLPPHPAAMLAATQYHADLGRTIVWGLVIGIPSAILAGPCVEWALTRLRRHRGTLEKLNKEQALFGGAAPPAAHEGGSKKKPAEPAAVPKPAGPVRAACAVLLPIALIFLGSWSDSLSAPGSAANTFLRFVGSPDLALLIAVLVALFTLGPRVQTGRHHGAELLRQLTTEAFEPIANVMVILAAAGGLSGILRDSGAAQATVSLALGAHMPPLVLAWLLAAVVRVSMGSATVAMAVSAGVLAPMAAHIGVSPELLVIATGTGSLMLSHVNDPGFWMVQSFFELEVKETLATWSVMETVLSSAGLVFTLVVSALVH
ncbi:MAG TPA: gluconate:H+ symporter [Terracidiphilus sp.]|nr:gluconate:H+ symporter [Terracidiphilus sp.]